MDISVLKTPIDFAGPAKVTSQVIPHTQPVVNAPTEKTVEIPDKTPPTDDKVKQKPVNLQDLTQMTEAMNKFVQAMDANIRFLIHEGTNQIIVQVVDQTDNKVLKEFPPHEFLDTMAAIRDYVGILLDKKI